MILYDLAECTICLSENKTKFVQVLRKGLDLCKHWFYNNSFYFLEYLEGTTNRYQNVEPTKGFRNTFPDNPDLYVARARVPLSLLKRQYLPSRAFQVTMRITRLTLTDSELT